MDGLLTGVSGQRAVLMEGYWGHSTTAVANRSCTAGEGRNFMARCVIKAHTTNCPGMRGGVAAQCGGVGQERGRARCGACEAAEEVGLRVWRRRGHVGRALS